MVEGGGVNLYEVSNIVRHPTPIIKSLRYATHCLSFLGFYACRENRTDNQISDISALVINSGLSGSGDYVSLQGNCLDINSGVDLANINTLKGRGVTVKYQPQKSNCN